MFRKMFSAVAVLALLQVLTAGAVQARPLAAGPAPAGFLQELWRSAVSSLVPVFMKDTSQIDPNGHRLHTGGLREGEDLGRRAPGAARRSS
jgi:hypothetical protein